MLGCLVLVGSVSVTGWARSFTRGVRAVSAVFVRFGLRDNCASNHVVKQTYLLSAVARITQKILALAQHMRNNRKDFSARRLAPCLAWSLPAGRRVFA